MNIEIIADPYKINKSDGELIIQTKEDYIKARFSIRDAFEKGSMVKIVIQNKGMVRWFRDLDEIASFSHLYPPNILKDLLHRQEIPKIFLQDPSKIITHKLIERATDSPIKPGQSTLDWILEVTIKFPWIKESIKDGNDVYQVLEWFIKHRNSPVDNALVQLCIEKLCIWKNESPFKGFLDWLRKNPFERAYLFCLGQILSGYPEKEKALWLQPNHQWSVWCQLDERVKWMEVIPEADNLEASPSLSFQIREYLQERLNSEGLNLALVKELSGKLEAEELALNSYLANPEVDKAKLPVDILEILEGKFRDREIREVISKLKPLPAPPEINRQSKIEEVLDWLEKYYFPFRSWCRIVEKEDLLIKPIAGFEDWVISNYDKLLWERPEIFIHSLKKTIHNLLEEGAVLLVIIDGLSWAWKDYLIRVLMDKGLYLEREPELRFSLLPSITEIVKPIIVTGSLYEDYPKSSSLNLQYYDGLFKEAYSKYVGKKISATDSSDTLSGLMKEESRIYLYLFNEIDGIIHKYGQDNLRDKKIERALDSLAEDFSIVLSDCDRLHSDRLRLVIVGDHGYLPPPKTSFRILPIDDTIPSHHGRVAIGIELEECYMVKTQFLGDRFYSLAKGFNMLGKKLNGCVHGGMTPDEMIVPLMVFSTKPLSPLIAPTLILEGEIRRGNSECPFQIKITNPNPFKILIKRLDIDLLNIARKLPWEISPSSTEHIPGILDASNVHDLKVDLRYQLEASCLGQDNLWRDKISLATKGAAIIDKAFEEEFDV